MNREQRRRYDKARRHDKKARMCPKCQHPARFGREMTGADTCRIICERCEEVVVDSVRVDRPYAVKKEGKDVTIG